MIGMGLRTGYDIKKYTESTLSHFWRESYGNLYPVLKHLEDDGLLTHTEERQGTRPPRLVYALTAQGRAELEDWLQQAAEWEPPRYEALLKILLAAPADPSSPIALRHVLSLRARVVESRRQLDEARARAADAPDQARLRLTLRFGELVGDAMLQWCDEAMAELSPPR
jgi:DNA-binding PadR family transcriptional regulator